MRAKLNSDHQSNFIETSLPIWLGRLFLFISNFLFSLENMTLRSACGLFGLGRLISFKGSIKLRAGRGDFGYRGRADFVVLDHFYKQGAMIVAPEGEEIRRILDLGANIGDETVKFAIRHPFAEIVALEPNQENYEILKRNCRPYPNICCRREAIWPDMTALEVLEDPSHPMAHRVKQAQTAKDGLGGQCLVEGVTIPFLLDEYRWPEVDILKMDVEGADYPLFAGHTEHWLPRVRSIIIELSDSDHAGSFQNFFRAAERHGLMFRFQIVGENLVGIRDGLPWETRVLRSIRPPQP